MADGFSPAGLSGLSHFDLPAIFRCAVELAEAAVAVTSSEWADMPVNIEGPASPHFERWIERHRRLRRIEEETERLKRSLGATGPLGHADGETDAGPKWESYDQHFNNATHDRVVRLALMKLATAAIDLSGFATWREWQWSMHATGLRLLGWGLSQLWEGMSDDERSRVRDRLLRTHKAVGWPRDPATDPTPYDGPEEIPFTDQYRIFSNYVSCYRDYLDDVQKANRVPVQQGQEKFLRRATLGQFIKAAERAAQALQAIAKRNLDSPAEWGELYDKAFWLLACLQRAQEVPPSDAWPAAALEQRSLLADAARRLFMCVGGTPEAKVSLKPADADRAFEEFTKAITQLEQGNSVSELNHIFESGNTHQSRINESLEGQQRHSELSRLWYEAVHFKRSDSDRPTEDFIKEWAKPIKALACELDAQGYVPWLTLRQRGAVAKVEAFDAHDEPLAEQNLSNLIGAAAVTTLLVNAAGQNADEVAAVLLELSKTVTNIRGALFQLERTWIQRVIVEAECAPTEQGSAAVVTPPEAGPGGPGPKPKRSTTRGEGQLKLIAALTKHHQYSDGSCLNPEPIGNNALARLAGVSESTASAFFHDKFDGHTKYKALCRDSARLAAALKLLNNEFAPHDLYGRRPAGEDGRDDDE